MNEGDTNMTPEVAEAMAPIDDLDQLETSDHVTAFTDTHQNFQKLLASPEDDTPAS
jgi:hypothetical protein